MLAPVFEYASLSNPLEQGGLYVFPQYDCDYEGRHVFSNDGSIPEDVIDDLAGFDRGIALHIGSGAMFSLVDKHRLDPIVIDRDFVTISMQKVTELAILGCATPSETTDCIATSAEELFGIKPDSVIDGLRNEAKNHQLGQLHWTNRFPSVKDALAQRPPTYILSDVRDIFLAHVLTLTAATSGPIQFFNLTNVHNHITRQSMDFLKSMPISPEATLLFSDWSSVQFSLCGTEAALKRNAADIDVYLSFSRYAMLDQ